MKQQARARHLVPFTTQNRLAPVEKHDGGHVTRGVMEPCALVDARRWRHASGLLAGETGTSSSAGYARASLGRSCND